MKKFLNKKTCFEVGLLGDYDFSGCGRSWRPQVADGELLDVLEHLLDALGNDLGVGVLVDAVLADGDVAAPRIHFGAVDPEAALAEDGELLGLADLDRVGGSEDELLDLGEEGDAVRVAEGRRGGLDGVALEQG